MNENVLLENEIILLDGGVSSEIQKRGVTSMTIQQAKEWFTLAVSVIAVVAGVIFWVQSTSDSKISNIEKDIAELRTDIRKIQQDNNEIIRIMGRLEGLIDK